MFQSKLNIFRPIKQIAFPAENIMQVRNETLEQ